MDIKPNVRQVLEFAIVMNETELMAMLDDPAGFAEQVRAQVGEHLAKVVAGTATNRRTPPQRKKATRKAAAKRAAKKRAATKTKPPAGYPCYMCDRTFKGQRALDKHLARVHEVPVAAAGQ